MDSHELTARSGGNRWIPLVAVIQDDVRQIVRHWAFWIWAGLAIILPILWMMNASNLAPTAIANLMRAMSGAHVAAKTTDDDVPRTAINYGENQYDTRKPTPQEYGDGQDYATQRRLRDARTGSQGDDGYGYTPRSALAATPSVPGSASQLGGKLLGMHILVWIVLAIALGASAISAEFASVGESVLCWGVARWQYFLGKTAARSLAAMTLVVVLSLPMLLVFNAKASGDLAFWPSIMTTLACAGVVGCVTAIGVAAGAWFRTSMRAIGVSVIAVLIVGIGCVFLAPPAYSPTEFVHGLPYGLRGVEIAAPSSLLSFAAYSASAIGFVSLGKFVWADL